MESGFRSYTERRQLHQKWRLFCHKKEDWEDDLPSGEKEKMEEEFNNMYHIVVDNPVFPCDPLTNRIWREFRRWQMSVTTTSQMKSLLYDQAPKNLRVHPAW